MRLGRAGLAILIALGGLLPVSGSSSLAQSVLPAQLTFTPVADTFVLDTRPNTAFGDRSTLEVDGEPRAVTYLRFDVRGTQGQRITRVRLRMHQLDMARMGGAVYVVAGSWNEATTWSTRPRLTDRSKPFGSVAANTWYTVEVPSPAVRRDGALSLGLRSDRVDGSTWASSESSNAPELILDLAPRIAAVGDIACDPDHPSFNDGRGIGNVCRHRAVSRLLDLQRFAAILALGDVQYEAGTLADFDASYDRNWGRLFAKTYPVPGNHEYLSADARGYFDYFGARAHEPGWYSFDLGSWHLIALNSNCEHVGCGPGSEQMTWLQDDLAANPTHCSLAFMHHPRFSSGYHGNTSSLIPLWEALDAGGVDLAIAGHDHDYEAFVRQDASGNLDPDGVKQFVVGTGGRSLRPFGSIKPHSRERERSAFGILKLELRPTYARWRFMAAPGWDYSDSFTNTTCR